MTQPQIPADWHRETYAVDRFKKVVWKQGSFAVAMGLKGKKETLIPGYVIKLCRGEELVGIRERIAEKEAESAERHQKRLNLLKGLGGGVLFYALLISGISFLSFVRCDDMSWQTLGDTERCVKRFGPVHSKSWAPWK